jgi:hypothetical protein
VDAGEFGAVPAVASLDVVDPSFGSGPPFHLVAEGSSVFELSARGTGFTRSWDRDATHSELVQVVFDRRLAVTAVGGDRAWRVPGAGSDPFDRRGQLRGVGRVPISTVWSRMTPSALSTIWALKPNSTGLPRRPLRIGRASTSCRLTSRLADSGITPARRLRVCATTRSVRPTTVFRSLIARRSRPLRCPWHRATRGLRRPRAWPLRRSRLIPR